MRRALAALDRKDHSISSSPPVQVESTGAPYRRRAMDESQPGSIENVTWQLSYDRESVDRFSAEVEKTRARLQAEIGAARERVAAAEAAIAAHRAEAQAQLGALVLAAHGELAEIEREQRQLMSTIRAAAEAEAARLLEAARTEAEKIRTAAASLEQQVTGGDEMAEPLFPHVDAPVPGRYSAACRERLKALADRVASADAG